MAWFRKSSEKFGKVRKGSEMHPQIEVHLTEGEKSENIWKDVAKARCTA